MSLDEKAQPLVKVCALTDLEDGEIFRAEVDGVGTLAVYKIGEAIYVSDNTCTHGAASLADDGFIEDGLVVCSWHDGAFDLKTGAPQRLPCSEALKVYPVEIKDEAVYISV